LLIVESKKTLGCGFCVLFNNQKSTIPCQMP